ncbi:MAG: hypothetical protein KIS92_12980 [Planctomycetota bacterium]|nr:hypothetical protein [Planctomycetota bacterium]
MIEIVVDREACLREAERRVRLLPEMVASAQRTDPEALEECLGGASEVVRHHARPMGLFMPRVARFEDGVLVLGRAKVRNEALGRRVAAGERVILYLATVGYTNMKMFEAVERDYVAYHFQHYLSLQLLFATANLLHQEILRRESHDFARYSILDRNFCDRRSTGHRADGLHLYWDTTAIAQLFADFDPNPAGVTLTSSGGLNPIYSLLGILIQKKKG